MSNSSNNNGLGGEYPVLGASGQQEELFLVERQVIFDDIEMGVLANGVPYLTGRGLEKMCGVGHGPFQRLSSNWKEERLKPRGRHIQRILLQSGYHGDSLYIKAIDNGREIHAYPEPVCLAILEYYAFIADEKKEQALYTFRVLARTKFRDLIYRATGYDPNQTVINSWKHFHDRVDMLENKVPLGYFCIFTEIASMLVPMIKNGVIISDKVIPDISVGIVWGKYWVQNSLDNKYGQRIEYEHNYPEYYPQAKKNPQPAKAYPDEALGEFRSWLRNQYIVKNFPKYLLNKSNDGAITKETLSITLDAFSKANNLLD